MKSPLRNYLFNKRGKFQILLFNSKRRGFIIVTSRLIMEYSCRNLMDLSVQMKVLNLWRTLLQFSVSYTPTYILSYIIAKIQRISYRKLTTSYGVKPTLLSRAQISELGPIKLLNFKLWHTGKEK